MSDHDHAHEGSQLSDVALRVRALETILTEKGFTEIEVFGGADGSAYDPERSQDLFVKAILGGYSS